MHWHVLLIAPSREPVARDGLTRRRYNCYWPNYPGRVRLAHGRKGTRQRSVLPGYMLIKVKAPDWRHILETPAVREVLRDADSTPMRVSQQDVDVIVAIEAAFLADAVVAEKGVPFRVGQRVRLTTDMLQQWEGTILAIDKRGRITLEIPQLFGRATQINVPVAAIEAA